VRVLCERIVVAQNDEIAFAQRWLREHQEFVPPADPRGHVMPGMDQPMLMPGMLTPDQMTRLDAARGPAFDRLFLTFMIQHHQGAITMVAQLHAARNIRLVSTTPPSPDFINRSTPGDFQFTNSDLSFTGPYVIQGNYSGVQVWDITEPRRPRLHKAFVCPGSQSDVSVYRKLLF